jgi:hypothetical protein
MLSGPLMEVRDLYGEPHRQPFWQKGVDGRLMAMDGRRRRSWDRKDKAEKNNQFRYADRSQFRPSPDRAAAH